MNKNRIYPKIPREEKKLVKFSHQTKRNSRIEKF